MSYYRSPENMISEDFINFDDVSMVKGTAAYNFIYPFYLRAANILLTSDECVKKTNIIDSVNSGYDEYVDKKADEIGLTRKEATYAEVLVYITGSPKKTLSKNSIVATKDNRLYFTMNDLTLDDTGIGQVKVKAEKAGSAYNVKAGEINTFSVKYANFVTVNNPEEYTEAYDQETNEELLQRYYLKVRNPAASGNKNDYIKWASEVTGVGSVNVIPSAGRVEVIISDSNKRAASEELIKTVYDHIDLERPLLAGELVVSSVVEKRISISVNVEIDNTADLETVKSRFADLLNTYFEDVVYATKKISIAKVQAMLMSIVDINDCSDLKINNGATNIQLANNETAVLDKIEIGYIV